MNLPRKNSKKNLQRLHKENPDKLIYFFDESRFGTNTKQGLGWFKKGSRTPVLTTRIQIVLSLFCYKSYKWGCL
jgi:hypothetical protein